MTWRIPGGWQKECMCAGSALALSWGGAAGEAVDFGRDILPILSENCFACHGPDEADRKGGLRLDTREGATAGGVVVAGDAAGSLLLERVLTVDKEDLMPPPSSHKERLGAGEVELLARWIDAGAEWGEHWSFVVAERPAVPEVGEAHPVDAFLRERLAVEGWGFSEEASTPVLLRRLSYDLRGLPPTAEEWERWGALLEGGGYEEVVDEILASPHHGERLAMWWLDAARYADTDGFQADDTRSNWPWRDWVIDSFRENKPFDRFTIEQFAGDLLEGATDEQIVATCFHRNHMTNGEGGRDPEESRIDYVIDRVNTVGTTWLGLTLECAQCHTHKYDPVAHNEYFALAAFFDSIDEDGRAGKGAKPFHAYESKYVARGIEEAERLVVERRPLVDEARRGAEPGFGAWLGERVAEVSGWAGEGSWRALELRGLEAVEGTQLVVEEEGGGLVRATGANPRQDDYRVRGVPAGGGRVAGLKLEVYPDEAHTGGRYSRGASGEFILTNVKLLVRRAGDTVEREVELAGVVADLEGEDKGRAYGRAAGLLDDDPRNGWTVEGKEEVGRRTVVLRLERPLELAEDEELVFVMMQRSTGGDANIGLFRVSTTGDAGPAVRGVGATPLERLAAHVAGGGGVEELEGGLVGSLREQYLEDVPEFLDARARLAVAEAQLREVKAGAKVEVMVLRERDKPRVTHVLERGEWDAKGEVVGRGVPSALGGREPEDGEWTRLELAEWIVSEGNPLTARVVANHMWAIVFGAGLVRTPGDFGLQGERPTHPELLDWLAVELVESGWDLRHLLRLLVTSRAYRQASTMDSAMREADPENRLWGRALRYRLPSWMLRDGALQVAGLLNPAIGGVPVRPYQPEGIWEEQFMGRFRYVPSEGASQYRRTLYAFWRRTSAPAFLFDSAMRQVCEVSLPTTNTPLQALVLMNDESYREAAVELAALAIEAIGEGDGGDGARVDWVGRRVLGRGFAAWEREVLVAQMGRARAYYRGALGDAEVVVVAGQRPRVSGAEAVELAAVQLVAGLILNLDEVLTRE